MGLPLVDIKQRRNRVMVMLIWEMKESVNIEKDNNRGYWEVRDMNIRFGRGDWDRWRVEVQRQIHWKERRGQRFTSKSPSQAFMPGINENNEP